MNAALLVLLILGFVLLGRVNTLSAELRRLRERLERLELERPDWEKWWEGPPAGVSEREEVAPAPLEERPVADADGEAAPGAAAGGPLPEAPGEVQPREPQPREPQPREPQPRPPTPMRPPAAARPAPAAVSSRTVFAVLGAAVTLVGAAWFLASLARTGVLTREVQLGLAAALAAALYLSAGRAAPAIAEAMRGLGYGILALCIGALVGAGVASPGAVLAALLALSLAVGLHGAVQGRLLGTATALAGASLSTWILADNLGASPVPHLALLGLFACTVLAERRLTQPGSALLAFALPVSLGGLLVTAAVHGLPGPLPLWALLLLGAVLAALGIGLRPEPAPGPAHPDPLAPPPRAVVAAASLVLGGFLGAVPLLRPLETIRFGDAGRLEGDATRLLLLVGAACVALAVGLHRRAGREEGAAPARLLRDATLGVGVGTLGGALALGIDGFRLSTRLLGLAGAAALLGTWMRSGFWRWAGTAALLLLLLDHLVQPWPSSLIVAGLGLGAAVALGRRAGAAVGAAAGGVLISALTWAEPLSALSSEGRRFAAAVLASLVLHGLARGLERLGQEERARTVASAAVASGVLLIPAALTLPQLAPEFAVYALVSGAVLYLSPAGRLAARAWGGEAGHERRTGAVLELLGVGTAVLGLLTWTVTEAVDGRPLPPLGLLLAGGAVLVARLPGQSRWQARAWPVLALAVLASLERMLDAPQGRTDGLWTLLGTGATLAALAGLGTSRGLRLLGGLARPGPVLEQPWWRDGALVALGLWLLALMGRTAELLPRAAPGLSTLTSTSLSTAVLIACSVLVLMQARRLERPVRWWVGLGAFGLGALKLVFFDLDDLGGMARGAGTVLIGLLLLGIGQLAPKPEPPAAGPPAPEPPAPEPHAVGPSAVEAGEGS